MGFDRRQLAFKAKHAGRDERCLGKETRIVDEKAGGEVIRAVEHDVVLFDQGDDVLSIDQLVIGVDGDLRIDGGQCFFPGFHFRHSQRGGGVEDLSLQVREVDDITVDETDRTDSCCGEIQSRRGAEPSCPDDQYFRLAQLELTLTAHVLKDNVAAVPLNLLLCQFHRFAFV